MANYICSVCKQEKNVKKDVYLHPRTKTQFNMCKKCGNYITQNEYAMIEFCRSNDIFYDQNIFERVKKNVEKDGNDYYLGYYLKFLNMNKNTNSEKSFKDSIFEVPESVEKFHESTRFERRQTSHHCRHCGKDKAANEFFSSADFLDKSGLLSVCKNCVKEIFLYYVEEHKEIDCAIYEACSIFNYEYSATVVEKIINEINEKSEDLIVSNADLDEDLEKMMIVADAEDIFGRYLKLLQETTSKTPPFDFYGNRPANYEDYTSPFSIDEQIEIKNQAHSADLRLKWGVHYSDEQLEQLEFEYQEWAQSKDLNEKSTDLLIKELCKHRLMMEENRAALKKQDYDIMLSLMDKAGAINSKQNIDANKAQEKWGLFIEEIEKQTPAELLDKRGKKYWDVHNIEQYIESIFVRANKNFMTGSRDFNMIVDGEEYTGVDEG